MFLNGPQDDFRSAEIAAQNQAAAAPASKLPRVLLVSVGVFLLYKFLLKGRK